jgi:hypothetical protein
MPAAIAAAPAKRFTSIVGRSFVFVFVFGRPGTQAARS